MGTQQPAHSYQDYLDDIPAFETFLYKVGFKRNEGAIFGLLVLSEEPLASEQIEQTLGLSQSSVSLALKKLSLYGAIHTFESRDPEKRVKLHTVKEDSLTIVATLFKKREQETIEEFKKMTSAILEREVREKNPYSLRAKRLKSIVTTCMMAESIMNFVIKLASKSDVTNYEDVVKRIPQVLDLVTQTIDPIGNIANQLKTNLSKKSSVLLGHKLSEGMMKFVGENYDTKK